MKAILEFDLPEDKEEFEVASKAMDWSLLVLHIDSLFETRSNMNKTEKKYYNLFEMN